MSKKQTKEAAVDSTAGAAMAILEPSGKDVGAPEASVDPVVSIGTQQGGPTPEAPKQKSKLDAGAVTLSALATKYLAHMEKIGKSPGTSFSYSLELHTAISELGAKTRL